MAHTATITVYNDRKCSFTYILPIYCKNPILTFLSFIITSVVCKNSQRPEDGLTKSETCCLVKNISRHVTNECINLQYICCVERQSLNNIQIHSQHDIPIQFHSLPDSCTVSKLTDNLFPNELFPFTERVSQGQSAVF
jgi:hypothetical protein